MAREHCTRIVAGKAWPFIGRTRYCASDGSPGFRNVSTTTNIIPLLGLNGLIAVRVEETNALLEQFCVLGILKRFDAKSPEGYFYEVIVFRFDGRNVVDVPLPSHRPDPQRHCFLEYFGVPLDKNLAPLNVNNKCTLTFWQWKC